MTTYNADNPLSTAPANVVTVATVGEVVAASRKQPAGTLIFVVSDPDPLVNKSLYICLPDFATSPTANTMKAYLIKAAMVAS